MEWRVGQHFLADSYNQWRDQYTWYLQITDFTSENNEGNITVEVELTKYDEDDESITNLTVPQTALIDEVNNPSGDLEEIDEPQEAQKTNVPNDRSGILTRL